MSSTYKDLDVYQRSFKAMIKIYRITENLPAYLQFDIGNDIRRAARSIPSNICEGYARKKSKKDIANFLKTSLGSNDEVSFNLEVLNNLNKISPDDYLYLNEEYTIIGKQLTRLLQTLTNDLSYFLF